MTAICDMFLKSVGFSSIAGADDFVLTNGTLETRPEFIDREGQRRWIILRSSYIDLGLPVELQPKTQEQLLRLLQYMRDVKTTELETGS
jgi:hypothetical protein